MADTVQNKTAPWWTIAKVLLAIILVGYVFSKTDLQEFQNLLQQISHTWLGIYIALFVCLTLLKAWQYYSLMGNGVSYTEVLGVIITQNALSNFLASTAGIASYITMFRAEHGIKIRSSVAIFILIKIGDLCAIWIGLIISSLMVWQNINAIHNVVLALVIGIGLALLFLLMVVFFRQTALRYLDLLVESFRLPKFALIQKALSSLESLSKTDDIQVKRAFVKVLYPSTLYVCASIFWIFAGYQVFNFQQGFSSIVFVSICIQIVSYLPIQVFGGLGVTETSSLYFWGLFEVHQSQLASILIGNRILFYLLNLLPLIYLPLHALFSAKNPGFKKDQGRRK